MRSLSGDRATEPARTPATLRGVALVRSAPVALLAVLGAVLAGCTPFGGSPDEEEAAPGDRPALTVTVPAVRLTPFCRAMIDLADRLESDPPDDPEAVIVDTYQEIEDEVPDAIREDFDAVLAALRGDAPAATKPDDATGAATTSFDPGPPATDESGATLPPGDPFFDEGYDPDDSPALRLNAYVDFECRGVANNPGPPPTQPLSDVVVTTDG